MTLEELVEKYQLTMWCSCNTAKGKSYTYMDRFGVNVIINDWDKSFQLKWIVPRSIFTIECPECSPYDHPGHFDKMYQKFINVIAVYQNACN